VNPAGIAQRWRAALADQQRRDGPPPRPSRTAWAADAILAAVLAATTVNYAVQATDEGEVVGPPVPAFPGVKVAPVVQHAVVGPWQLTLAVLTALPLAARRRYPLSVFWVVIFATLLFHADVKQPETALLTFASCLIAAYSAVMYCPYRRRAIASVVIGAALLAIFRDGNVPDITAGFVPFFVVLGIGLAANATYIWQQRVRALEAEQEATTRQAVQRERARIARELHDVVTHNVAVMIVQAGAARKVIDAAPDKAREAMLAVEAGGRAAMTELRHVMGLLNVTAEDGNPIGGAELAPQPGLDNLAALAERIRDAGVPVELTVRGAPAALPPGVDLAAYRVVQEALTNAVKHAAGANVQITVNYSSDAVEVEVTDTGGTSTTSLGTGNGRGLIGLRERLAVYGGTLHAGARPTGGYRVRATIPVHQP
jgi:signal transduction histidine kinase